MRIALCHDGEGDVHAYVCETGRCLNDGIGGDMAFGNDSHLLGIFFLFFLSHLIVNFS